MHSFVARWIALLVGALALSLSTPVLASPSPRVALVVGNSTYRDAPLKNPVNDARAMSRALRHLGFEVIERTDVTQREFNRAVTEFGEKLGANSIALVFYAGHGIQVRGKNYLIPVDAQISSEASIRSEAVDVDVILEQVATTGSGLNFVILDACRNNPFERRFRSSAGSGLAQMDAPKGTFIAYATAPGKTASDGDGENGLYTQELLKALTAPGLKVEDVFKKVRIEVARLSNDYQLPWESSSLTGDFYFKLPEPVAGKPTGPDAATLELELWKSAQQLDSEAAYQAYLDAYPSGRYSRLANIGISQASAREQQERSANAAMLAALEEANRRAMAAETAAQAALAATSNARQHNESIETLQSALKEANERAEAAAAQLEKQQPNKGSEAAPLLLALADPEGSGRFANERSLDQPRRGDQWIYRFTDLWKKSRIADYRVRLESVDGNTIKERIDYVDPQTLSPTGQIMSGRWIERDKIAAEITRIQFPESSHRDFSIVEWLPYNALSPTVNEGFEWDGPFAFGSKRCSGSAEAAGLETITVPAGEFKARRIDLICTGLQLFNPNARVDDQLKLSIWYAAGLYRPIRLEKTLSRWSKVLDRDVIELVGFSR